MTTTTLFLVSFAGALIGQALWTLWLKPKTGASLAKRRRTAGAQAPAWVSCTRR